MKRTPCSILVTGAAGFIGFHTAKRLKEKGHQVIGLDNFCPDYDPQLKRDRAAELIRMDVPVLERMVEDGEFLKQVVKEYSITHIVHLAGHGSVRKSWEDPASYIQTNFIGFFNILEAVRANFSPSSPIVTVYASSSSVYGEDAPLPFSEKTPTNSPMSPYGATKKCDELLAYPYYHKYGMPLIGLRFFTVYGPWGRPDMASYSFAEKIVNEEEILLYEKGDLIVKRDFAYIDDIVDGIEAALFRGKDIGYAVVNLGNNQPVAVEELVRCLEKSLGRRARLKRAPLPDTDAAETCADLEEAKRLLGFAPKVALAEGIDRFAQWYKGYRTTRKSEVSFGNIHKHVVAI